MLRLVDTLMYLAILFCKVALGSTVTKELYWTLNFPHKIQRSTVDGQNIEDLITGLSYPLAIAVDQINRKRIGVTPVIFTTKSRKATWTVLMCKI